MFFQAETHLHFGLSRSGGHLAPGLVVSLLELLLHVVQLLARREGEHALQLAVHQIVLIRLLPLEILTLSQNTQLPWPPTKVA